MDGFIKIILINCSLHPACSFPGCRPALHDTVGQRCMITAGQRCMITAGGCCTRTLAAAADGFIISRRVTEHTAVRIAALQHPYNLIFSYVRSSEECPVLSFWHKYSG